MLHSCKGCLSATKQNHLQIFITFQQECLVAFRYLDYIEEKKDIGMIIRLYERCLVACASYPGNVDCSQKHVMALHVLQHVCGIHFTCRAP